MIKIINKTNIVLVLGSQHLQPGINYIPKTIFDGFWSNGLMSKLNNAVESGKIEVEK